MQILSRLFSGIIRDHSKWGFIPLAFAAMGWALAALWIVPWLRDFMVTGITAGDSPSITHAWPPPLLIVIVGVTAVVLLSAGIILFSIWSIRNGGLGSIIEQRFGTPGRLALAISIWTTVISIALLARGDPIIGDAKTHISRAWIWKESLKGGAIPVWTDLWYGGFPVDQHYSPLSHILVAAVSLSGIPPFLAGKIVAWLSGVIGAVGFGIWCQSYFRSHQSGFMGGIIYSLIPTSDAAWVWYGRLPGVLIMGILPWAFYVIHRMADRGGSRRAAAFLALCISALTLTHVLQARLALAILAVYTVAEFALRRGARPGWLIFGWGGGLTISFLFIIPAYLERDFVNAVTARPFAMLSIMPHISQLARQAVRWNPKGDWYPGLTVLLLSVLGMWYLFRAAMRETRSIRTMLSTAAMLVVPWIFAYGQTREEELLFYGVMIAAAASFIRSKGWRRQHMLLIVILLLLLDLGPANLISTYVVGRERKETAYSGIESSIGSGRYLELPLDSDGIPRSSHWHYVPTHSVASVGGPFIQGAPRSFIYRAALIDSVAFTLTKGSRMSERLVEMLKIENVKFISLSNATSLFAPSSPLPLGVIKDEFVPAWRVEGVSPVSIIDSLPAGMITESSDVIMPRIGKDYYGNRSVPSNVLERTFSILESMQAEPVLDVKSNRRPNAVDYFVPDVGRKTLRIALAAYPTLRVYIDGRSSEWRAGPLGGILIDVGPGSHTVSIEGGVTHTRIVMSILLAAVAAGMLISAIIPEKRNPPHSAGTGSIYRNE